MSDEPQNYTELLGHEIYTFNVVCHLTVIQRFVSLFAAKMQHACIIM